MKRRLLNLLTALSLLLCMAVGALWVRSCYRLDWGAVVVGLHQLVFVSTSGGITIEHYDNHPDNPSGTYWAARPVNETGFDGTRHWDFAIQRAGVPRADVADGIRFPHWAAIVVFAAMPAVRVVREIRRQRLVGGGRCPKCGYDLRATPGRCPECGAAASVTPLT